MLDTCIVLGFTNRLCCRLGILLCPGTFFSLAGLDCSICYLRMGNLRALNGSAILCTFLFDRYYDD